MSRVMLLIGVGVLGAVLAVGWLRDAPDASAVRGRWIAPHGRHAGLVLEIGCERVRFVVGRDGAFASQRIDDIAVRALDGGDRYVVSLVLAEGHRDAMRLTVRPGEDGVLYMGREQEPWVRDADVPAPWDGIEGSDCPAE